MYLDRLEYKKDTLRIFDGRCRLVSLVLLAAAVLGTSSYAVIGGVALVCLAALGREIRITALRLVPVNIMSAALWLSAAFGFDPSRALLYTLRINCAALLSMCFVFPMGISAFAASMAGMGAPQKLISLFILTHRYIFFLYDRLCTALTSMRLRCTQKNDLYRWRSMSAVFASALTGALFRGEKVWAAMLCRGFDGAFPVTVTLDWKLRDSLLLAACAVFSALVIIDGYGIWKSWF
ncbi:MAG: energy-coupling factor transporter transmembrane protein EcfT [Treponema sp.]|jgi:cobalt/nickel transport system permease protein|nr:energy-coupling factor transporter transmembrane protein EcfT [Treponema sp.]